MTRWRHSNRRAHNWLAYAVNARLLQAHAPMFRGALYDLGAGEAPYRDFFLRHADTYVAVDWEGCRHERRADILADLNGPLPVADGAADTVVALSVLEHLREPRTMLGEAFRILKPGGWILVQVPWQWMVHETPDDYFRYTPYGLRHLLEGAGFSNVRVEPLAGFFSMMTMKVNYFSLRLVRGPAPLRWCLRRGLGLLWHSGQLLAPLLDRLDRNWELEATGFAATARKPRARDGGGPRTCGGPPPR